jgi:hypothetical protein
MKSLKFTFPFLITIILICLTQNIDQKVSGIYGNLASESSSAESLNRSEIPTREVEATQSDSEIVAGRQIFSSISNDPYNANQWYLKTMQVPDL